MRRLRIAAPATLAAVLWCAGAEAAGVSPLQATAAQREEAQGRFLRGRELYKAGRFEAGLAELNASLDVVESPNTRLFIARSLREMGRPVAAYAEFGRSASAAKELARDDPRYEGTAEAAAQERKDLEAKLGFAEITVAHAAPETTLRVAGEPVARDAWSEPVPIAPGSVDVVVESPGRAPITKSLTVRAGEKQALAIDAGADAPEVAAMGPTTEATTTPTGREKYRPVAYAAGGLAAAGLVTFVVAGALANGTYSDLEQACGNRPCPPGHEDEVSKGRTQQTLANIGAVVFAVGTISAVTLWVISSPRRAPTTGATGATRRVRDAAPGATISVGPSFVGIQGAFR